MRASCTLLLLAVAVALAAQPAAAWSRQLQADNCTDSPGATRPQECTNGFLGIGGNQWDNNEIECHVCTNSSTETYQLKCNLNFKFTSNNTIDCELDQGPLHSAIKFSCDAGDCTTPSPCPQGCTITCDWRKVQDTVPGCAYKSIRSIFNAWHPKSNAAKATG